MNCVIYFNNTHKYSYKLPLEKIYPNTFEVNFYSYIIIFFLII